MSVPLLKVDASFLFLNPEQKRGTTMTKSQTTAHEPTKKNESDFGAHSNSPESTKTFNIAEKYTDPLFPGIHKVSWDKISILGNLDPGRAQSLITNFCNEPNIVFQGAYSSRGFHVNIMDAVDCRFNLDGPSKEARTFSLSFNPNNTPEEFLFFYTSVIAPCLTDVGFSRLDLAIDTTEDLGTYHMDTVNPTKKNPYISPAGKLETIYLGAPKGVNYIRIYDKKNQLKDKKAQEIELPELWRIEFQLRGKACADTWTTCADKLMIHKLVYSESVSGVWKVACEHVRQNPDAIGLMSTYERQKCRKLLKESKGTDLMPVVHQAIKQSEQRLQAELEQWMPGGTEQ